MEGESGAHNRAARVGGLRRFATGRPHVELLTITKLITSFDTYDTEQEAIASFMATA